MALLEHALLLESAPRPYLAERYRRLEIISS